ncbi:MULTISPECIES: phage tail tape measure protein [unclassified Escherichia]|uniref:phage tail tape measure protein n=1 Tax=unclassified Escherichia TaxID=2608889 RepID=UPI0010295A74|nr:MULTISPECIES: phage tail tape measure protein [unclassified Escherichia]RZM88561.1 hypothetical protein D9742_08035 [Escherichia sp. E1V33]TBR69954.1 hypothetical protein D9735_05060 [Escherichia sp. E1S7]
MGILDTFVFLLETDNRDALRGLRDADNALDDVEDGSKSAHKSMLGMFDGVLQKAGITTDGFKELAVSALGIAGAGLSLNAVLDHMAEMLSKVKAAETVGVDIGQYDALSKTFQSLGVDADGFRDSMIDLNEAMGEAASDAKSGKAESFKTFGVSLKDAKGNIKSADQALLELAGSMEKMDKQQATFQIKQLGITDNAVIAAMLNGQKALERQIQLQKDLGVLNEKDVEQLKRFKQAQNELSTIFSRFADQLAMAVVPALELVIETTQKVIAWGREHKAFLFTFFGALATVVIPALTASLWRMAAAAWGAMAPFIPFIAVAAALGLVVEDLWQYFNGGESVIGDLVQQFPALAGVLDNVKESFLGAWEALKLLFSDPSQFMVVLVAELKASWDEIVNGVVDAGDAIADALSRAWEKLSADTKQVFTELLEWVKGIFSNIGADIANGVGNAAIKAKNAVKSFLGMDTSEDAQPTTTGSPDAQSINDGANPNTEIPALAAAKSAHQSIAMAPMIPPSSSRSSSISNTQNVNVAKVEVTTQATDAQGIASSMTDGLKNAYGDMANQYDDGRSH